MTVAIIAVILCALMIIWGIAETKTFGVKEYNISNKFKIEKKILVIADFHNKDFGKNNKKLLNKIENINPDIIIIVGDLVECKIKPKYENSIKFIDALNGKYKIIFAEGNHEARFKKYDKQSYETFKKRLGRIDFIVNEKIEIENLYFYGLSLSTEEYYAKNIEKSIVDLLGEPDTNKFNFLLAHSPVYFEEYMKFGADITLCGHIHGGTIRVPFIGGIVSPGMKLFPKYDSGKYEKNGKKMIVSRGIGEHTIKLRFFNKPEILLLNLKGE